MADFEIRSLRVSAQMDASQYTAGAQQKVAADKAMVASGQAAGQSVTETNTKISQAGDVLSRLSRQYVDGYAAAQRFNSALTQLSNGIERGKISAEQTGPILDGIFRKYGMMGDAAQFAARGQTELATAITRANAKLAEQRNINPVNQNQGGLARFGAMNAASQFQDIAVTSAMGQSPLTIMLQQGTQLGQALQMELGDQGVKGLVNGLGAAFGNLLSPVNLLAIGLTGVAAVAIEFGYKLFQPLKTLDQLLKEQTETVKALGNAYGDVAAKAQGTFTNNGQNAFGIGAGSTINGLRIGIARETRNSLSDILINRGTGASGNQFGPSEVVPTEFAQFSGAIEYLRKTAHDGQPDIAGFRKMVEDRWALDPNNVALTDAAAKLKDLTDKGADAERQLKQLQIIQRELFNNVGPNGFLLSQGTTNTADMGNLSAFESQQRIAQRRSQQTFDAGVLGINAKSPQELAVAARAEAAASYNDTESSADRAQRIDLAGRKALIEAEHALKEAQDERKRSLDQTMASAQLDLDLVGKTTAQIEGLRMAAQLEAQVREAAARNHVAADEAEIARIKQKAEEYGRIKASQEAGDTLYSRQQDLELQRAEIGLVGASRLEHDRVIEALKTEQYIRKTGIPLYGEQANGLRAVTEAAAANAEALAKANAQQSLLFDLRQLGRSPDQQSVASQLRSLGFSDTDLDSDIAKVIKMRDEIGRMKDTWNEVFDVARSGIDGVVDALFSGGSIEDALKKAGQQLARTVFDMAVTNPLKNWLTGSNLNTIADLGIFGNGATSGRGGGFGGVLGNLLGAQKAVASMQVQAASVFINGSPLGGIPGIPGLPGAANDNSGPFDWLKSLFGGQSAQPFQTNTTLSDILGYGGQNNAATAAKLLSGLGSPLGAASSLTGSMAQYASAIKAVESLGSGGYSALGPLLKNGNQALGAYQIMKSNLPSWSSQTFGSPMSVSDFMSNPAAQDAIFNKQFGNLLSKYGNPQDAASAWFTGGPLSSGAGKMDILGTTGSQYVDKFNAALGQATQNVGQLGGASSGALSNLVSSTSQAAGGLNALGSGAGKLGSILNQFPAAPGGGGGGNPFGFLGNIFSSILGGGGLNPAFSGTAAYSFLSANPGSYIGLYADGTESAPPGWAWVGEKGPELKKLRAGDVIRSNPRSMDMMKASGGGAGNDNMKDFVRMLAPHLKTNVKNINIFDPSVVGDYLNTPAGEEVIMNVLRRNNR